jgi:dTDP-4-dehydrorhamnose reductase
LVGGNCLKHLQQEKIDVVGTYMSYPLEGLYYFNTLQPTDTRNNHVLSFQPTHIIHCGALTHVDYCETHADESYVKTVRSTQNLLDWCNEINATLVYFSTDYVFDGLCGPYAENDTTNPLNVYGKHKLEAEQLVLNNHGKHL